MRKILKGRTTKGPIMVSDIKFMKKNQPKFIIKTVPERVAKRAVWQYSFKQLFTSFAALVLVLQLVWPLNVGAAGLTKDFDQCANEDSTLGDCNWIGSIVQQSNSKYYEGMSVPQRILFTNVGGTSGNAHSLTFSHQANKSTVHAYDFLTSWSQAVAAATAINPGLLVNLNACDDLGGLASTCATLRGGSNNATVSIPDSMGTVQGDSVATRVAAYEGIFGNRTVEIYGNSPISSASLTFDGYSGSTDKNANYTLTWTSASTQVLIEMAGHLAVSGDGTGVGYGLGKGASNISGGSYHFKLDELDDDSLGSQDNQIKGADVIVAPPQQGTVVIVKDTVPNGPQDFAYTTTGGLTPSSFSLDDDTDGTLSNTQTFSNVAVGTYSISEIPVSGFDLTDTSCVSSIGDTESAGSLELDNGETITCTFTNTQRGTIIVVKDTVPDDPTDFQFTSQTLSPTPFFLDDDADGTLPNSQTFSDLIPGTYDVSETADPNYDTFASCDDQSDPSSIQLDPGETITCTFTNTIKQGGITIVKLTNPQSSQESFEFDPDWGSNFTLTGNGDFENFQLDPEPYLVSEVNIPSGWDLTSATCVDQDQNPQSPGSITLEPDGSVTCTFVNTQRGHIIVDKVTDPAEDEQVFDFGTTGSDYQPFSLSDTDNPNDQELVPGNYSVSEDVPDGWLLTNAVCDNEDDPSNVTLGAGETVTCTFTNVKLGAIEVTKNTVGGDGTFEFTVGQNTGGYQDFSITTTEGSGTNTQNNIVPGTYSASEIVPDGWIKTSDNCQEIVVEPGQMATCTVENTKQQSTQPSADLEVTKTMDDSTADSGQTVTFTVTVANLGPDAATGVVVSDALPGGLSFVSATSTKGSYDDQSGDWTVGDLAVEENATLTLSATVTAEQGSELTNTASTSLAIDPNPDNNSDSATVTVNRDGGGGGGGPYTLTVTKTGDGNGTVIGAEGEGTSSIFCALDECRETDEKQSFVQTYVAGTIITLTADPDDSSNFNSSWSGACTGNSLTCQVTMNSDQSVNAHFARNSNGGGTPPPPTGGGGPPPSGGGPPPVPQVLGTTTPVGPGLSMPPGEVLGAATELPRTGGSVSVIALITLLALALLDKRFKLV